MKNILFIEEESIFSRILTQLLNRLDYSVTLAHDGCEGIGLYRRDPSDLVMVDLCMPGRQGLDVLRRFRETFPEAKLIALSSEETGRDGSALSRARKLGVRRTFRKPFATEELLHAIEEEMR